MKKFKKIRNNRNEIILKYNKNLRYYYVFLNINCSNNNIS